MKNLKLIMGMLFLLLVCAPQTFAETSTATATVTASVPSVTLVSLARDTNSASRGSAVQILFDKLDSADMSGGNDGYMYAPYRSETNMNWHIAQVVANGATMVLSMTTDGSVGTTPLSSVLKVWCGGFFTPGATTPITGTASADKTGQPGSGWEYANGFQRSLSQPFVGTVPFNYQLNVSGLASGSYSGGITITLTTT